MIVQILVTDDAGVQHVRCVLDDRGPHGSVRITKGQGTPIAEGLLDEEIVVYDTIYTSAKDPAAWLQALPVHYSGSRLRARIVPEAVQAELVEARNGHVPMLEEATVFADDAVLEELGRAYEPVELLLRPRPRKNYDGTPKPQSFNLGIPGTKALAEKAAIAFLAKQQHQARVIQPGGNNNFPYDLWYRDGKTTVLVEVKGGWIGGRKTSQQFRLTRGILGTTERAEIAQMTPEERRKYGKSDMKSILARKEAARDHIAQLAKGPVRVETVAMIVDAVDEARGTIDVFQLDGVHPRIGWNSEQADQAYAGTYQYGPLVPVEATLVATEAAKLTRKVVWDEKKYRRDKGRFASKGGPARGKSAKKGVKGQSAFSDEQVGAALRQKYAGFPMGLSQVGAKNYTGQPKPKIAPLGEVMTGVVAEKIAIAHLRAQGKDARPLKPAGRTNYPFDLWYPDGGMDVLAEAKGAEISSKKARWKAAPGKLSKSAKDKLAALPPERRAVVVAKQQRDVFTRKLRAAQQVSRIRKRPVRIESLHMIVDASDAASGTVDVHHSRGVHGTLGFRSPQATKSYKGTYKYSMYAP